MKWYVGMSGPDVAADFEEVKSYLKGEKEIELVEMEVPRLGTQPGVLVAQSYLAYRGGPAPRLLGGGDGVGDQGGGRPRMKQDGLLKRAAPVLALPEVVSPTLQELGCEKNTCVLSSWIGRTLLQERGITAKPVPVRALVVNAAMWEFIEGDWAALAQELTPEIEAEQDALGAWCVHLGAPWEEPRVRVDGRGRMYGAHLILTTRNPDFLIDLTLDQVHRPQKNLTPTPIAVPLDREQVRELERGDNFVQLVEEDAGIRAAYYALTDPPDFRRGYDWGGGTLGRETLRKTMALIRRRWAPATRRWEERLAD